jgi:hypothetical protein
MEEYFIFTHVNQLRSDRLLNIKEDFTDKITFRLYSQLEGESDNS